MKLVIRTFEGKAQAVVEQLNRYFEEMKLSPDHLHKMEVLPYGTTITSGLNPSCMVVLQHDQSAEKHAGGSKATLVLGDLHDQFAVRLQETINSLNNIRFGQSVTLGTGYAWIGVSWK